MYLPDILVPEYHQEKIADIHRDTMMQIMSQLIFMEHGSKPTATTVNFLIGYVTDQLQRFNAHVAELKKLKATPIVSENIIQNFGGVINRFIQTINCSHKHN